jgi:hypothetical protein
MRRLENIFAELTKILNYKVTKVCFKWLNFLNSKIFIRVITWLFWTLLLFRMNISFYLFIYCIKLFILYEFSYFIFENLCL